MPNEVLVAVLALVGTLFGSGSGILISNKLVNYRIEQLEIKLDKYTDKSDEVIKEQAVIKRDLETAFHRIDELREEVHKTKE
jgi:cell division protein FtsB